MRVRVHVKIAGYESVEFELEPVAAAHYYESMLDHDELILIGRNKCGSRQRFIPLDGNANLPVSGIAAQQSGVRSKGLAARPC